MKPNKVKAEYEGASVDVNKVYTQKDKQDFHSDVLSTGLSTYDQNLQQTQQRSKINEFSQYIEQNNLSWEAGETSISKLSYEEKKKLFPLSEDNEEKELPNLQGFEYYAGGTFEVAGNSDSEASSDLPSSFDWRDRHGENWLTGIRDQGQCGSCWAFGATAAVEAVTNLYFNRHLDKDLSEQQLVSCEVPFYKDGCRGWYPSLALDSYTSPPAGELPPSPKGITKESCFEYEAESVSCSNMCNNWADSRVRIKDRAGPFWFADEEAMKKKIIESGPLSAAVPEWNHAMAVVGWETTSNGDTAWIFKNNWGKQWGENGYGKMDGDTMKQMDWYGASIVTPITIADQSNLSIKCEDEDGDGYCNWGISNRQPASCPSFCKDQKDCDDSDPRLGPFDSNFNCTSITRPELKLISPDGGEHWEEGETHNIRWRSSGIERVDINLEKWEGTAGGPRTWTIAEDISASSERYSWTIEDFPAGDDFKINIKNSAGTTNARGNNFSITRSEPVCRGDRPPSYYASGNVCYYNCTVECTHSGWGERTNCDLDTAKPNADANCTNQGWKGLSYYTKYKSGGKNWLKCDSGDPMVGWYHKSNNFSKDKLKIKCWDANLEERNCSLEEKTGNDNWLSCDSDKTCTGKYHHSKNWSKDVLKSKCCEFPKFFLGPCHTVEKSGNDQWIKCDPGEVMTEWYHKANNWSKDKLKIKCCLVKG